MNAGGVISHGKPWSCEMTPHREAVMGYTLKEFCEDHPRAADLGPAARAGAAAGRREKLGVAAQPGVRRRDLQGRYAGRAPHAGPRSGHRRLCAGPRLRGAEEGHAAQSRRVVGRVRHRARRDQHDGMAARECRERRAGGPGTGRALCARPRPDPRLWPWRAAFDRTSRQGLGDPRHRHRRRCHPRFRYKPERDRIVEKV